MHLAVYVDESGDLGTSEKATRFFVMCALVTHEPKKIHRVMKRVRERVLRKPFRRVPELKFTASSHRIRMSLLEMISQLDVEIWYVCLKKRAIYFANEQGHNRIYNDLAGILLEHILATEARNVDITIDRSLSKANRERFDSELRERVTRLTIKMRKLPIYISLKHVNSQEEPCIQAVDFVCGAVFNRHERGDSRYYDLIKARITMEEMK